MKKLKLLFVAILYLLLISTGQAVAGLLEDVQALNLGVRGYVIGAKLTGQQQEFAQKHLLANPHEGTYKFQDQEINVVVDEKTQRILAIYKRIEKADRNQLKAMVMELMDRFSEPTTMAHDKIIYWAFNKKGAVPEVEFERAKEAGKTPELGIIATVKLNSTMKITPDPNEKGDKDPAQPSETGTIYYVITSDPLVQEFLQGHDY